MTDFYADTGDDSRPKFGLAALLTDEEWAEVVRRAREKEDSEDDE